MSSLIKFLAGQSTGKFSIFVLTLLRVFIGLAMAFGHGLAKLLPSETLITGLGSLGLPLPTAAAWFVALGEFLGGLLLATGLLTRLGAGWLVIIMLGAAFHVNGGKGFQAQELAFLYLLPCFFFLVRGGGPWSLDAVLVGDKR